MWPYYARTKDTYKDERHGTVQLIRIDRLSYFSFTARFLAGTRVSGRVLGGRVLHGLWHVPWIFPIFHLLSTFILRAVLIPIKLVLITSSFGLPPRGAVGCPTTVALLYRLTSARAFSIDRRASQKRGGESSKL